MELSRFSDYSLRALMYAALHSDETVTIARVASAYNISENHLVKITHHLGKLGFLTTKRGRSGGFQLARPPEEINLGDVIRSTESLNLVDCLGTEGRGCPISSACLLKGVVLEAKIAFLNAFDRHTLKDIIQPRTALLDCLTPK